jgi:hypothetical protein
LSLKQPDVVFYTLVLPVIEVDAAKLVRISPPQQRRAVLWKICTEEAVVLFDRALGKLTAKSPYKEFQDYPGSLRVLREFNVLPY